MSRNPQSGVSLIESLIAGIFLAAAITTIFAVISQGAKVSQTILLRQQAFRILESVLESPEFSTSRYLALEDPGSPGVFPFTITLEKVALIGDTVDGIVTTPEVEVDYVNYTSGGTTIPAKTVVAKVKWTVEGTRQDSAELSTILTR